LRPSLKKGNIFPESNHALLLESLDLSETFFIVVLVHDGKETWCAALDGGCPWFVV
jgi:hypothetical protein